MPFAPPTPHPLCPAGLAVYTDHDHADAPLDVPRHVDDLSFCNHTPRPEGLPTEILVGVTDPVGTPYFLSVDGDGPQIAADWLSRGIAGRRVCRATLTYQAELTRIPPVPASTEERPVTWS